MNRKGFNFFGSIRSYLMAHYYRQTLLSRLISLCIPRVPALPSFVSRGRVLDIGCGSGDTLIGLKVFGWKTYGIDIDDRAVKLALKRGVDEVLCGSYTELRKFPDKYFDAIRLYHVIEHLDDPALCLELIKKKLKPKGELIIGTPNMESLVSKIFGPYWYNLDSPRHLYLFSPKTLSRIVLQKGFLMKNITFCSAGGIVGSIGYAIQDTFHIRVDLIHRVWLVLLFYPLERLIDIFGYGDVFVLRANNP